MSTTLAVTTSASLVDLVRRGARPGEISAFLDGLTHADRLAQVVGSSRGIQPGLYALAAENAPLDLDYFVPTRVPAGRIVQHHGWNNLPIPGFGRRFAKPMGRCPDGSGHLYGYNQSVFGSLIGPGYFVHTPTLDQGCQGRGATVIDYLRVPAHAVPEGWPPVVPNTQGLQRFVYGGTRDYMRRVSAHVTIGTAYKGDKPLGAYFMLVRED